MASSASKVSLKLLVDTKGNRVLYAEAGKDFVDFLFNVPSLPLGTVLNLLTKESMAGCLGNLYESIQNLSETYMQPNLNKNILLEPQTPIYVANNAQLLLPIAVPSKPTIFFKCRNCCIVVASDPGSICPDCKIVIDISMKFVESKVGGYVKEVVKYMVMDDLVVNPMSTDSIICLFKKFSIKDLGDLEERVVDFGMDEAIKLLKASLESKTVLSSLFLPKNVALKASLESTTYSFIHRI